MSFKLTDKISHLRYEYMDTHCCYPQIVLISSDLIEQLAIEMMQMINPIHKDYQVISMEDAKKEILSDTTKLFGLKLYVLNRKDSYLEVV